MTARKDLAYPGTLNSRRYPERLPALLWTPLLTLAATVFSIEIPFFFLGTPSGHDVEFHLYSWLEVLNQWHHGILYPRWAALAHFGCGEPRFIFYPPASWMLGSILSTIFPWRIASPVFIWLVLVLAGSSMFLLVRRWFGRSEATFAAVLYAVNPYHLVIVYWRSAFAEMLASCLVPVLLLLVLKAVEGERRIVVPLGLVLAASWLTNAPAAVMIHYSLALLVLIFAWKRKSLRLLWIAAGAVLLGALLSAFYLFPAIYEQRWIDIANAISPGSRPADNFLFIHTTDPDHDAFNRIISWVALLEMGIIFFSVAIGKLWKAEGRDLWNALLIWAVGCSALMFPVSLVFWRILPKLQFMQFPWRWLLCLSLIFTIFVTAGVRRWGARAVVFALSMLLIGAAWHRVQAPWWDNSADLREMQDNMADHIGYEGTDEYTPVGAEPSEIDKDSRNVTLNGPAKAAIHVQRWDAETKLFTADVSAPDQLDVKLFPYPAWRVIVNGHDVQTGTKKGTGQMLVPVEAGMNRVEIHFTRTWDRTTGGWISIATLLGVLGWLFAARRYRHGVKVDS